MQKTSNEKRRVYLKWKYWIYFTLLLLCVNLLVNYTDWQHWFKANTGRALEPLNYLFFFFLVPLFAYQAIKKDLRLLSKGTPVRAKVLQTPDGTKQLQFTHLGQERENEIAVGRLLARSYEPGETLTIFIDPNDPSIFCIERDSMLKIRGR